MNNLHLIVREQFPEFVQEDYPVFVSFVESYYAWLDSLSVGKLEDVSDLDKTPESFVIYFRYLLDNGGLFNSIKFNPLFLQKIKQIYTAKGSEQALISILKLVHGSTAVIRYPSENILKASDARWAQNNFITVETVYGEIPTIVSDFYLMYGNSSARVSCEKYDQLTNTTIRLFFKPKTSVVVSEGQLVYVYSNSGQILYAGKVIRVPVSINVVKSGQNWQLGQVIKIPGEDRDTVVRVAELTTNGGIKRVEVIEFGFGNSENQTILVSPYPNKPVGSIYDYSFTITSVDPIKYHHSLQITDYLEGVVDRSIGYVDGLTPNSYFLELYVDRGYASNVGFDINITNAPSQEFQTSVTMEQWLESRATLIYNYGTISVESGRWLSSSGLLSNPDMRLQDSLYYQQFSYDVEADAESSRYIQTIKQFHPIGLKAFTTYSLEESISVIPELTTSFPLIKLDFIEDQQISDSHENLVNKKSQDSLTSTDLYKQTFIKKKTDSLTINDSDKQTISKRIVEALTVSDVDTIQIEKPISDGYSVSESNKKTYAKYVEDSVTITSSDDSTYNEIQYNADGYFGEFYVITDKFITIGA